LSRGYDHTPAVALAHGKRPDVRIALQGLVDDLALVRRHGRKLVFLARFLHLPGQVQGHGLEVVALALAEAADVQVDILLRLMVDLAH
jgi:hypothetical protein